MKRLLTILSCLSLCLVVTSSHAASPDSIPTKEKVGAQNLPADIAPVKAPFAMPAFSKPVFPKYMVSVKARGAKENVLATRIIQSCIDATSKRGGGTVVIPRGNWLSGRISLKSNVNLHFEDGAVLTFSADVADYRPAVFTRNEGIELMSLGALIYANGQHNIAITGKGRLVGPGEGSVRKQTMTSDVIERVVPLDKPVSQRIYEGYNGEIIFPPMFISPINCTKVYIEGVSLERTAFWNIVPVYCDNVIIRGITVNSVGIQRGDGIDIESSKNVLIEYSTLASGDDCFTIKAGRGEDGIRVNKPTQNVVVRYCLAREGHGGITCGSETAGMIRNLYVHDCVFDNTGVGIRFKTRRNRGGGGENIWYERIRMNLKATALNWDMLGGVAYVGELAHRLPQREINKLTPQYRDIHINNIIIERSTQFLKVNAIPETPLTNLTIENVQADVDKLIQLNDADGITIKNVSIRSKSSDISTLDARNVSFNNVVFNTPDGKVSVKSEGPKSTPIKFINCTPENIGK